MGGSRLGKIYEIVILRARGRLSLAVFLLQSLLTSPGWRSTGVESNMENAITAAPEVKERENPNGCEEKELPGMQMRHLSSSK